MPIATLSGAQIHYQLEGSADAPLLVLSHPLTADLSVWNPQMPEFLRSFRVLRYDTRGHGQSSVPPGPYAVPGLARDVIELLDSLSIARAHFCGLSLGGVTGIRLAAEYPDRLLKVVVSNTAAHIGTPESWNARIETARNQGMQPLAGPAVERWLTAEFRSRHPEIAAEIESLIARSPVAGYIACCEALLDSDQTNLLSGIRIPMLVIAGTHDGGTTPAEGRFLASSIPCARYAEFPAAHLSNVEASAAFTAEVIRFLIEAA